MRSWMLIFCLLKQYFQQQIGESGRNKTSTQNSESETLDCSVPFSLHPGAFDPCLNAKPEAKKSSQELTEFLKEKTEKKGEDYDDVKLGYDNIDSVDEDFWKD